MACRAVARQSEGWSARDDLHVQGCLILSQVGLLFPVNHTPLKLASLIPPSLRSYCGQARLRSKAATDGCGSNQESVVPRELQKCRFAKARPDPLFRYFSKCRACSIVSNAVYSFTFQGRNFEV